MRGVPRQTAPRRAPRTRAIERPAAPEPKRRRASRSLPLGMPPRGWLLAGWSLLPVRAFLAVTFLYAGFQKLMNPAFLDSSSPNSLHQQMIGYIRTSPIHLLLGHLLRFSTPLGVLMSLGEIAVGLGMALGLWTRIAAIGGMLISFSLFLAVSFHSHPWYTGADIVFLFMFTPFVLAGAGGVLSLDARIAHRAAEEGLDDERMVVLPFAEAQHSCGNYDKGRCTAVPHRHCAPNGCPYLEGTSASLPGGRAPDHVDRRAVVLGGVAAAAATTAGLVAAGAVAGVGRIVGPKVTSSTQGSLPASGGTGSSGSPNGTLIGAEADVPVGQSATFTVPNGSGDPGLIIQSAKGQFVAYDAVCPHAGCQVAYFPSNSVIACPCHGSEFDVSSGNVIVGPATVGLTPLSVTVSGGQIYIK